MKNSAYIVIAGNAHPLWVEAYPTPEEADAAAREAWAKMDDRTRCNYPVHIVRVDRDSLNRSAFHEDGSIDWCDFREGAEDPCPDLFDARRMFDLRGHAYMVIEETDTDGVLSVFDSPKDAADEASSIWCRGLTPSERKYTRVRSFMVNRDDLRDDLGAFERFDDEGIVNWEAYDSEWGYAGDFDSDRAERIAEAASELSDVLDDAELRWDDLLGDFKSAGALPARAIPLCRAICEADGEDYLAHWDHTSRWDWVQHTEKIAVKYGVRI